MLILASWNWPDCLNHWRSKKDISQDMAEETAPGRRLIPCQYIKLIVPGRRTLLQSSSSPSVLQSCNPEILPSPAATGSCTSGTSVVLAATFDISQSQDKLAPYPTYHILPLSLSVSLHLRGCRTSLALPLSLSLFIFRKCISSALNENEIANFNGG